LKQVAAEPCPACGGYEVTALLSGTDRLYQTTQKRFQIVECCRCRLIRLSPQPPPSELIKYYPPDYWFAPTESKIDRLEEFYRRVVLTDHVRFVRQALAHSSGKGIVLDVGCGGGLFLHQMTKTGARVAGLDFSLDAATIAWRSQGVPAVCASLAHAPFARGSCSVVTMFHVLEHLYEPQTYLESAYELLEDEGRLVVQVPNAGCWQFVLLGEKWRGLEIPRHLYAFRQSDLEVLLDRCGFEPVRYKHFSLRDNPAGLATSLAPWLDPTVRRVRRVAESPKIKLPKDCLYFCLVLASLPLTLVESACRAGFTLMVEARKKK